MEQSTFPLLIYITYLEIIVLYNINMSLEVLDAAIVNPLLDELKDLLMRINANHSNSINKLGPIITHIDVDPHEKEAAAIVLTQNNHEKTEMEYDIKEMK